MVHWFCVLVLVLFTIDQSFCINCYSCSSQKNEGCLRPYRNKIPIKKCNLSELNQTKIYAEQLNPQYSSLFQVDIQALEPQMPLNCLKQVIQVGSKEVIIRGCQLPASDNLDICVKINQISTDAQHTKYCSLCNADGCNTASHLMSLSTMFIAIMLSVVCLIS